MRLLPPVLILMVAGAAGLLARAEAERAPFLFPTSNRALLDPGREIDFFAPTAGNSWESGQFGCVRSEGWQFHEGIDIRAMERGPAHEPSDPILAAAAGSVAYINDKEALSNYGKYIVLLHTVEGLRVYSLYAHLSRIEPGLAAGKAVAAGEKIGVMGRTANTQQAISKERAHLHFEIGLVASDRFAPWHAARYPGQKNEHGSWNGQNLLGLDPAKILLAHAPAGSEFSFLQFVREQAELCRVLVRRTDFPWLQRSVLLVRRNAVAEQEGIAGYEMALNFSGFPFQLIPRAHSEIGPGAAVQLLSVQADEREANRCGRLVLQRGGEWQLTDRALRLIDLLTY